MDTPDLLSKCFLFRKLPVSALAPVAAVAEGAQVPAGETIFWAGDQGDAMYLIRMGSVVVQKDGNELARLGTGAHFGEIALLDGEPRSATVKALEHTELLVIRRDRFEQALRGNDGLAAAVYREFGVYLCRRLRRTDEQLVFFKDKAEG